MRIISHRGNLEGTDLGKENTQLATELAIKQGFDVELDIWGKDGSLFLGHDLGIVKIEIDWLTTIRAEVWAHCKNMEASSICQSLGVHWFSHDSDPFVSTSKGLLWAHPTSEVIVPELTVMLDVEGFRASNIDPNLFAVCTDWPKEIRSKLVN